MTYNEYLRAGKWHPCTTKDASVQRKADGGRVTIRGVVDVPKYLEGLTLDQLQKAIVVRDEGRRFP